MSSNQDSATTKDVQQKDKVDVEPSPPARVESTQQTDSIAPKSDPNPQYIYIDGERVKTKTFLRDYQTSKEKAAGPDKLPKAVIRHYQEEQLKPYQAELIKMQQYLVAQQRGMIILFEGRDAAGKGGTIRRVTRYMNEKRYRVVAMGKPTQEQRTQWYFQKYIAHFPRGGEVVLFDRSWYNRAMVERIFGFCTEEEYQDFMRGVSGFEKDLVRQGTILLKLYFSVTKEEQARRFERRKTDPLRQWKLSEVDLQAQDRWDEFSEEKYQMLKRSSTYDTPWLIIRSKDKHKARLNAMKVILNTVPYENRREDLDFAPDPKVVVSAARELEHIEANRLLQGKFTGYRPLHTYSNGE
jgi:polyphosphate kinase 2